MKAREIIGGIMASVGIAITFFGFCSLDSEMYFDQAVVCTVIGLFVFAIGGAILQIFDW